MTVSSTNPEQTIVTPSPQNAAFRWLALIGLIYVMLVAVGTIGSGFKFAAGDQARSLFEFASNPFTENWR